MAQVKSNPSVMTSRKPAVMTFAAIVGSSLVFLLLILGIYIFSICWRVSIAEQNEFGRSDIIPLSSHSRHYNELTCDTAYGDGGFVFNRSGKPIIVYKQLTNGFQHAYGSALASYELGDTAADLLFRANEYAESGFARNAGTRPFYEDTKKDLANNAAGRELGNTVRVSGLKSKVAEQFIVESVLSMIERNEILRHWQDPRVKSLKSPEQFGCPYLTLIQEFRRGDRKDVLAD